MSETGTTISSSVQFMVQLLSAIGRGQRAGLGNGADAPHTTSARPRTHRYCDAQQGTGESQPPVWVVKALASDWPSTSTRLVATFRVTCVSAGTVVVTVAVRVLGS